MNDRIRENEEERGKEARKEESNAESGGKRQTKHGREGSVASEGRETERGE